MKTLLFGGSFDPIHNGHLQILEKAKNYIKADKVVLIPSRAPRWKRLSSTTDQQRIDMIKLAIKGEENYSICLDEMKSTCEINYTYDTIVNYKKKQNEELYFLIGYDHLEKLDKWHEIDKLSKLVQFIAISRPDYQLNEENVVKYNVIVLKENISDMSSSALRFLNNLDAPKSVLDYIVENSLYYIPTIKNYISQKRFEHTVSVANLAFDIAESNHLNPYKAYLAGLLHDIGKELPKEEQEAYVKEYFMNLYTYINEALYHQFVSEAIARDIFKIEDEELLNAIKFHATGSSNMDWLSMIVYSADKIEPTRKYDTSKLIEECKKDYYKGFIDVLRTNIDYLDKSHKDFQNPLTNSCIVSYLGKEK